jgi:hypothetical protein
MCSSEQQVTNPLLGLFPDAARLVAVRVKGVLAERPQHIRERVERAGLMIFGL